MTFLDKLERKFGGWSIPRLTEILIVGQVAVWLGSMAGWIDMRDMILIPALVLEGQFTRLATFLFIPISSSPFWMIFVLLFYYYMGTSLEAQWGEFRYNLFIFIGYIATVAFSFLAPYSAYTNTHIWTSLFLAFAILYPDNVIYIYFILPVKMKWVAALTCVFYVYALFAGGPATRLSILASLTNIAIFFGGDLLSLMRSRQRKATFQAKQTIIEAEPVHTCAACGKTERTHPHEDFRYCSKCSSSKGYCSTHIQNHGHS